MVDSIFAFHAANAVDLLRRPLMVGILQNQPSITSVIAHVLQRSTNWKIFSFDSFEHAREVLSEQPMHVFLTHWHIGDDHGDDSMIMCLVRRLKEIRGGPGVGAGPLLAATINQDDRFLVDKEHLADLYDLWFLIPFSPSHEIIGPAISARLFQIGRAHV